MIIVWAMLVATAAFAQLPVPNGANTNAAAPAAPAADPLGRETPAGMVAGFLGALAEHNYERAAEYLDLSKEKDTWGPSAARQLQRVLDQGGYIISRLGLSTAPAGDQDDGLMPNQEKFGAIRTINGNVDLLAERVERDNGKIWLVSAKTVAELPELSRTVISSRIDRILPDVLRDNQFAGAPIGHWLAIVVLAMLAYALVWLVTGGIWLAVFHFHNRFTDSRIRRVLLASARPIRVLLTTWALWLATVLLGVSIIARQHLASATELLGWIAISWIVWRVVDAFGEFATDRMTLRGRLSMLSAVTFIRRSVKFAIFAFAAIAGLDALGFNVTAGLAALGIGGLAIALGAQKTIEHLVGSLTLVADQPIRVGDFCRFGETIGTVEDIGMRSTRIRTLERTLVTVPNGQLASLQIENYSRRDKFWFHPILDLRYETTPDQMRNVLAAMRKMLLDHPRVDDDPARVRLIGLGSISLQVEIFAYVHAINYDDFLEVKEDLILRLMELIEDEGTGFAFPSQTVYVTRDKGIALPKPAASAADNQQGAPSQPSTVAQSS
ncbi:MULTISPECIES: mechanosensitive ion channel family protein [Rhodopseudomonas]|nr:MULTISPECIES: mechanosensitive ion channel family protein [Rhodopseudomonas]MDF3812102.1 mechanosensitive ion channel family protein [Rhodopseudomonas sp. BAL398]WOK16574.1 mechanosensitive ion channel family protein [Rhodopseudomonas sp. BAL398]